METLHYCKKCNRELMNKDIEAQELVQECPYYTIRDVDSGETWETSNPFRPYESYCYDCFAPRLQQCKSRVVGAVY